MPTPQKTVPTSVATALLVLSLAFFGIIIGLAGALYYQSSQTQELAAQLVGVKNRDWLQAELMAGDNRHALFPHADKRVGFVLNRNAVTTSLYAADGDNYPINDIGLRGNPIEPKGADVIKRIAVVSDSWWFGWRLADNDLMQNQLKALLLEYYPGKNYEVITVAVPGWNVENQAAFLEDYFDRLQPDILLWSINPNDLWDTQSVVPPGVPASRPAQGLDRLCPDSPIQWSLTSAPIVLERWQKNIALMNGISKAYGVPIIALHTDEREPYVSMIRQAGRPTFPIVVTPGEYQNDGRWQIDPGVDSHPTRWASTMMATQMLGHLIEHGHLPPVELNPLDKVIVEKGMAASRGTAPEKVSEFINSTHGVPKSYARGTTMGNPAITAKSEACPQGRISLGRRIGANSAEIIFEHVRNDGGGGNGLHCSLKLNDGHSYSGNSTTDKKGAKTCRVDIPPNTTPQIVDLYWNFDKFTCVVADDCFAADFASARVF